MHLPEIRKVTLAALLLLLATLPAGAEKIESGADLWWTPGDGSSYYDFGGEPIPAGFFCRGSEAFRGKVAFQGAPLATSPPGALGNADTVIQRLDDAVFNAHGQAVTRVQPLALALVSTEAIETSCGAYLVRVGLAGEQPTADMVIVRENEAGGYYHASLSLNLRLTFVPESGRSGSLSLDRRVDFPVAAKAPWSSKVGKGGLAAGLVSVDTDNDGLADRFVPSSPGFAAGTLPTDEVVQSPIFSKNDDEEELFCSEQEPLTCHEGDGHMHCYCGNPPAFR